MRLSDIVAHTRLGTTMALLALGLAVIGFAAVVLYVFLHRNRAAFERARHLPLEGDSPSPQVTPEEQAVGPADSCGMR